MTTATKMVPQAGYARLIVKPEREQEGTVNGIIVPGGADNLARGTVVSVGTPDEKYRDRECPFQIGDRVVYVRAKKGPKGDVTQFTYLVLHGGEDYEMVLQAEVIAVV